MSMILAEIIGTQGDRIEQLEREADWYAERAAQHQKEMQELRAQCGLSAQDEQVEQTHDSIRVKTMRDEIDGLREQKAALLAWLDASWRGDVAGADNARKWYNDAAQTKVYDEHS